jgi:LuxR family maltose regulon positive regulatory protein
LHKALPRYRENMAEQQLQLAESFALAALASCYIWALYEANQLQLVLAVFDQYHDIIAEAALPDFLVVAFLSASRARQALGHPLGATETLDELESVCYRNEWHRLIGSVNWERSRQALVAGAIEQAQAVASHFCSHDQATPEPWLTFSEDMEGASLGQIRLAIHGRNFDAAARALCAELGQQPARVRRRIKLLALDALLKSELDMREAAQLALSQALQLAEAGPYVRVFVEEGPLLHRLLHAQYLAGEALPGDARAGAARQFLRSVLEAAGIDLAQPGAGNLQVPMPALTSRELQILRYLAAGVSNREIAERIYVSENTVKFHLKNIYSKLAVGTRIQAISAARHFGLLD